MGQRVRKKSRHYFAKNLSASSRKSGQKWRPTTRAKKWAPTIRATKACKNQSSIWQKNYERLPSAEKQQKLQNRAPVLQKIGLG